VWPQARAALIALHMLALGLLAFPAPSGGMSRSAWKDPTVQAELQAWNARFASLGVELTQQEFEDRLWELASAYMKARQAVLDPFEPYHDYMGTWQSWRMFVAPHRFPAALEIDVEEAGVWRPVYVERSREHAWMGSIFDHDRMRSEVFRYSWAKYKGSWRPFGQWVARNAARDFPGAQRVRVRYLRYKTLDPEQARAGEEIEGSYVQPLIFELEEYR
jgi:hypothetical protein